MAVFIHIAILVCIYIILALALNAAVGFTGLLNFGHIAFFGMGAYTSALLTISGVPFSLALIFSGAAASVLGVFIAAVTNRLRGEYLALATLGFAFIFSTVLINWSSLTRGPLGIPGIPKPSVFGFSIMSNERFLLLAILVTTVSAFFIYRVLFSRFGRLLEAVRDDAVGLAALGKNVFRLKAISMAVSTFFMGVAGSLYAHYVTYIDPSSFMLTEVIILFTIIIVGGMGSFKGSIIGAVVIVILPELLRFVSIPPAFVGPARQILYAVILLGIVLFKPRGFFGRVELE